MNAAPSRDDADATPRRHWHACPQAWSFILLRYLPRLALLSLGWEIAHLPLYTIWREGSPQWIAYAVAHCTVGDVLIGVATLLPALVLARAGEPARWPVARIATFAIVLGVAYTVLSERINIAQGNWAYSPWMPVLPGIEMGLSPLLQWVVVPLAALHWARRQASRRPGAP